MCPYGQKRTSRCSSGRRHRHVVSGTSGSRGRPLLSLFVRQPEKGRNMSRLYLTIVAIALFPGCSHAPNPTQEDSMSSSNDSGHGQLRVFAESCILRCIGEFDAAAQKRLLNACKGAPYKTADE